MSAMAALLLCLLRCCLVMFLLGVGIEDLYCFNPLYPLSKNTFFASFPLNRSYCSDASGMVLKSCSVSVKLIAPMIMPVINQNGSFAAKLLGSYPSQNILLQALKTVNLIAETAFL